MNKITLEVLNLEYKDKEFSLEAHVEDEREDIWVDTIKEVFTVNITTHKDITYSRPRLYVIGNRAGNSYSLDEILIRNNI